MRKLYSISNMAEEILNSTDPKIFSFASIYHNKGNIFKSRNDFYRTKEYYEYALDFLHKNGYQNTDRLLLCLFELYKSAI